MDINTQDWKNKLFNQGLYKAKIKLPLEIMREGKYFIRVASVIPAVEILDIFPSELNFTLLDTNSPIIQMGEERRGIILPVLKWDIEML